MNFKVNFFMLVSVLGSSLQAYQSHFRSGNYEFYRLSNIDVKQVVVEDYNSYHSYMRNLAANPCLGENQHLMYSIVHYLDHASSFARHDILRILARNPSIWLNEEFTFLVQEEIRYQHKENAFEAFSFIALASIIASVFIYSLVHDSPSSKHATTIYHS